MGIVPGKKRIATRLRRLPRSRRRLNRVGRCRQSGCAPSLSAKLAGAELAYNRYSGDRTGREGGRQISREVFHQPGEDHRAGEVAALAKACEHLKKLLGLAPGTLRIELMIETTQSVINERGEANLLPLVDAGRGRCASVHLGVYDYTAACGITAAHQNMLHPVCDFAREVMQVALAGTGVQLSDGATNVLPVPVHRASGGAALTGQQIVENRAAVHAAWKLHFGDVRQFHSSTASIRDGICIPRSCRRATRRCMRSFSKAWSRLRRGCAR